MNFSQIHRNYIRNKVGQNVVKIVKLDDSGKLLGGGTGFIVNTPHGKQVILTNAHVCEAFNGRTWLHIQLPDGKILPERILNISSTTDLCAVEAPTGFSGLNLASGVDIGEEIYSVGFPKLQPLTVMAGEVVGNSITHMLSGIIGITIDESSCQKPKNNIVPVKTIFGPLLLCVESIKSQITTVVILGGNSGSPAVNFYGNVVGVMFAAAEDSNWGDMVPIKDIKDFISPY